MNPRFGLLRKLGVLALAAVTVFGTAVAGDGDDHKQSGEPLKVVVHINFADAGRQGNGLKNIENILKAAEAAGTPVEVEVVCHSDGINLLEKAKTGHAGAVEVLVRRGVRFAACQNTMKQRSIRPEDLLSKVSTVASGAFEVVRRQQDGYSYFKP